MNSRRLLPLLVGVAIVLSCSTICSAKVPSKITATITSVDALQSGVNVLWSGSTVWVQITNKTKIYRTGKISDPNTLWIGDVVQVLGKSVSDSVMTATKITVLQTSYTRTAVIVCSVDTQNRVVSGWGTEGEAYEVHIPVDAAMYVGLGTTPTSIAEIEPGDGLDILGIGGSNVEAAVVRLMPWQTQTEHGSGVILAIQAGANGWYTITVRPNSSPRRPTRVTVIPCAEITRNGSPAAVTDLKVGDMLSADAYELSCGRSGQAKVLLTIKMEASGS